MGVNVLNSLPNPTRCTDEQLAMALGYLFTLGDEELMDRYNFVRSMTAFLTDPNTKRPHKSLRLRNLKIYGELLDQAITARIHSRMRSGEKAAESLK